MKKKKPETLYLGQQFKNRRKKKGEENMKTIRWKIKDSWVETKKDHPGVYTDYLFYGGWVTLGNLFPSVKSIYAIGGHIRGSHLYWHNFRNYDFNNVLNPFKTFFLRIDLGRWFVIITKPQEDKYKNVDII